MPTPWLLVLAEGVAHSLLVIRDNGSALAVSHPLGAFEVDDQGRPQMEGDLGGGLHEELFDFLTGDTCRCPIIPCGSATNLRFHASIRHARRFGDFGTPSLRHPQA